MPKTILIHNHILTPKHILMNEKEVEELLAKYNISKKQMPAISVKDPAIKELQAKGGDVIRIIRNSQTQLKSDFWRVVKE